MLESDNVAIAAVNIVSVSADNEVELVTRQIK